MATFPQQLILTVLPFGQSNSGGKTFLDFSLIISPRLSISPTTTSTLLSNYHDFADPGSSVGRTWPDTVAAILSSIKLKLPTLTSTTFPVTLASFPNSALFGRTHPNADVFAKVFPGGTTPVIPYSYDNPAGKTIQSAPVAGLADAVQRLWGMFGAKNPTAFPAYAELAATGAFGPVGFQQPGGRGAIGPEGTGIARKAIFENAIRGQLNKTGYLPKDLTTLANSTGFGSQGALESITFLAHQMFLNRDLPYRAARTGSPAAPSWDFHQAVAGLGSMPTLLRALGIVLDLRAGPIPASLTGDTDALVTLTTSLFKNPTTLITPITKSHVATGLFFARSDPSQPSDTANRMLKIGDTANYRVIRVDHDSAAVKAIQFANNVTRSRLTGTRPLTPVTPNNYALPALRTGGFAVARSGRAAQMHAQLQRQTSELQNGGSTPTLWAADIIRGYRFDVLDRDDSKFWRSLMWRTGTITVNGHGTLTVTEEDTVVPAPAKQNTNGFYLQETLARWDGWSLAVPRLGRAFSGSTGSQSPNGSSGFNLTTEWHVPGAHTSEALTAEEAAANSLRLPRLRFGSTYQIRARATDLAGNSLPVAAAATSGIFVSPALRHLRFEPVAAPRAHLLRSELWTRLGKLALRPGDSEEVVVIRSESASVDSRSPLDNGAATRLLTPAPTSVFMAEQHGAFDTTATGKPMNQKAFAAIAARDAWNIQQDGTTLDQLNGGTDTQNSTTNPFVYPNYLPVGFLPEYIGRIAAVRGLPPNSAHHATTAALPFDPNGKGWLHQQAARVRLSRSTKNDWVTKKTALPPPNPGDPDNPAGDPLATSELDLQLGKGYMFTTFVNCLFDATVLDDMALWEWIQDYAQAHGISITKLRNLILAGEHWMFTPWRKVTFIHAVRTPLLDPVLLFKPAKLAIGDTFATFHGTKANPNAGTIKMSRRSTATMSVDASWSMPIDTGTNPDPVTPVPFSAHAFSVDITRTGFGWVVPSGPRTNSTSVKDVDAVNLDQKHEFGDTKFRAVTYRGTATSYYTEYYRLHQPLDFNGADPITALRSPFTPNLPFEATTVELTLTGALKTDQSPVLRKLVAAPPGTDVNADPAPGDFVVVEDPKLNGASPLTATKGTIQILANSPITSSDLDNPQVDFSYVEPKIHTFSHPSTDKTVGMHVPNSARPKAPDVLYAIPIYRRVTGRGSVTRVGGGLRVYLNRPWWSSGDQERLGVVCWHQPTANNGVLPDPRTLAPYVTQWGFDPIFKSSTSLPAQPTPACFPNADVNSANGSLTLEETTSKVDVAGHRVGFDSTRNLWYCDIHVTGPNGNELTTYTPFIRLALARYQPFSIAGAHLSRVVLCDYAQLAPNRHVTMTGTGSTRTVTVVGRSPRATSSHPQANRIVVYVEQRDTRIKDDALAWNPVPATRLIKNPVTLTASASGSSDLVTWRGTVVLPSTKVVLRLTFEEYERIDGGEDRVALSDPLGTAGRLVYTETINIT